MSFSPPQKANSRAYLKQLGMAPVTSVKRCHKRLYAACGSDIVVLRISDWTMEHRWSTAQLER